MIRKRYAVQWFDYFYETFHSQMLAIVDIVSSLTVVILPSFCSHTFSWAHKFSWRQPKGHTTAPSISHSFCGFFLSPVCFSPRCGWLCGMLITHLWLIILSAGICPGMLSTLCQLVSLISLGFSRPVTFVLCSLKLCDSARIQQRTQHM